MPNLIKMLKPSNWGKILAGLAKEVGSLLYHLPACQLFRTFFGYENIVDCIRKLNLIQNIVFLKRRKSDDVIKLLKLVYSEL